MAGPWPGPGWPLALPWLALGLALGWALAWPLAGPVQTGSGSNKFRFRPVPVQTSSGSDRFGSSDSGSIRSHPETMESRKSSNPRFGSVRFKLRSLNPGSGSYRFRFVPVPVRIFFDLL